jgi:hypothetical protein
MNPIQEDRKKLIWFLKLVILILIITGITDIVISFYGSPNIPKSRNPFMTVTNTPTPRQSTPTPFVPPLQLTPTTKVTQSPTPSKTLNLPQAKVCPMDAKLCPDGKTFVGRDGPNCAFVACPKKDKKTKK